SGNVYNIPVCLWLLDTYPYNPPICFVKPTSAMMIKTGKHIDANGKIYLPYLHEWKHPQSDLYGLIQVMIVVFGEEPPVFSRPTTQPPYQAFQAAGPPNRKHSFLSLQALCSCANLTIQLTRIFQEKWTVLNKNFKI
ncbi:tumor susceptibility gene 101 protein-like, partial [Sinocyclocheilus rhinocerous]|uniref:tumor susceptibility gene 101 protein-like n=1 Tax=Sinocyclocheilus rhinocerous TaxID=307959 RepID=UPI0007B91587